MSTSLYAAGVFYASACTDDDDTTVVNAVNAVHPHLVPWTISRGNFNDGAPNPAPCNHGDPARRHVLLTVLNEPEPS